MSATVNPHAKVASADQQAWVELVDGLRQHIRRYLEKPNLSPEEIGLLDQKITEVSRTHVMILNFDAEVAAMGAKLAAVESQNAS